MYALNGVRFEKPLWTKIVKGKLTGKEILTIENIEQRMAVIKTIGMDKIIGSLNAKVLDTYKSRGWELLLIENVFDSPAYFLRYKCPSSGREYVSGIKPEIGELGKASIAMAWKFKMENEVEEYLKIRES